MAFFIQLISVWLVLWIISKLAFKDSLASPALKGRIAFSFGFIVVGIMHLVQPEGLTYMIDGILPYPRFWVYLTGVLEIVLALLLHVKKLQKVAGWLIIIYLIAVFPANINVAIQNLPPPGGLPPQRWYVWSRLLFQPLYIGWVYLCAIRPEIKTVSDKVHKSMSI